MAELTSIKIHEPPPEVGEPHQLRPNLLTPSDNERENSAVFSGKPADEKNTYLRCKPINLKWSDITYKADNGNEILKGLDGSANAGELTAIMGPSGAGKSTLLNVLSGYKRSKAGGNLIVNGVLQKMKVSASCYIMQDDHVLPHLTVRETIHLAARLRLPTVLPKEEREKAVEASIDSLGLRTRENNRANKLSGGERKRLCIAQELVCNPYLIFLDEPTSGLDSASCLQCVQLLKSLAAEGRTVICTIHQPSSRIFELFDNLYMLAEGQCIYEGSIKNLIPFLSKQGLSCPTYHNPADYFMEVASGEHGDWIPKLKKEACPLVDSNHALSLSIESTKYDGHPPDGNHISSLNLLENQTEIKSSQLEETNTESSLTLYATSSWNQFKVLFYRSLISKLREPMATHVQLAGHVLIGVLIGLLYYGIGNDATEVINNNGCLLLSLLVLLFTAMMPTLLSLPLEKTIFTREHINNWYNTPMYYLAKTSSEIPFQIVFPSIYSSIVYWMTAQPSDLWRFGIFTLSCIMNCLLSQSIAFLVGASASVQNAVFLGPISVIPFTLFSGFFISLDSIPYYMKWLSSISYARYCFHAMLQSVYGFNRPELDCNEKFCPFQKPENFLREIAMEDGNLYVDLAILLGLLFVFRLVAYFVLYFTVIYKR